MKKIFILDDVRTVEQALSNAGLTVDPDSLYVLVRPFSFNMTTGEIEYSLADATSCIKQNPKFDLWVLDNDLGPDLEGYHFLREVCKANPEKVADVCRSCSSNPGRREDIEAYHSQFIEYCRPSPSPL